MSMALVGSLVLIVHSVVSWPVQLMFEQIISETLTPTATSESEACGSNNSSEQPKIDNQEGNEEGVTAKSIIEYILRCFGIVNEDGEDAPYAPLHDQIGESEVISNIAESKHISPRGQAILEEIANDIVNNLKVDIQTEHKTEIEKAVEEELAEDFKKAECEAKEIQKDVEEHKKECDRQKAAAARQMAELYNKLREKHFWKIKEFYAMCGEPD